MPYLSVYLLSRGIAEASGLINISQGIDDDMGLKGSFTSYKTKYTYIQRGIDNFKVIRS